MDVVVEMDGMVMRTVSLIDGLISTVCHLRSASVINIECTSTI